MVDVGVARLPLRRLRDALLRGVGVTEFLRSVDRPRRCFKLFTGVAGVFGVATATSFGVSFGIEGACLVDSLRWVSSYTNR